MAFVTYDKSISLILYRLCSIQVYMVIIGKSSERLCYMYCLIPFGSNNTAISFLHQSTRRLPVLVQKAWITCQRNKPRTSVCESKLCSIMRSGICGYIHVQESGCKLGMPSFIMPWLPRYFSAGINCRQCSVCRN